MSLAVVARSDTDRRMARRPFHVVAPAQQVPSRCDGIDDRIGRGVVVEVGQRLIERDGRENLDAPSRKTVGETFGEGAAPLDEIGEPLAAVRRQHGPSLDSASAL